MNTQSGLEQCLAFVNCQLRPTRTPTLSSVNGAHWRAVTISRQAGAGGHLVAEKLAEYLQAAANGEGRPWTVFDRNLVEKVLEDHHLPGRLAKFMPEDRVSAIADTLEDLFGLHPPAGILAHKTAETILHLAELGNVILIGRAANIITSELGTVFHVRLVGSMEKRIEYTQQSKQLDKSAALAFIRAEDRGRRRYLKEYFHKDIDDPLLYHVVINTDLVGYEAAAMFIANAMQARPMPSPSKLVK